MLLRRTGARLAQAVLCIPSHVSPPTATGPPTTHRCQERLDSDPYLLARVESVRVEACRKALYRCVAVWEGGCGRWWALGGVP